MAQKFGGSRKREEIRSAPDPPPTQFDSKPETITVNNRIRDKLGASAMPRRLYID
jgi:hypothetical protein